MNKSLETLTKLRLFLEVDGIGPGKLFNLISKFKSVDNLINTNFSSLINTEGISQTLANKILKKIDTFESFSKVVEKEIENLTKINAKWTTFWSDDYPQNLKNIYAPPIILYYKGTLEKNDSESLAIVGTRMPTQYGKKMSENFAGELAKQNIKIVSGMARGIDTFAHYGTLKSNGRTFAIVGSGLDVIYPAENKKLFNQIVENGAVISEYKLGTKPDAQNFPKRNRIISGISLGTLVVETKMNGGAIQTARFALDQNKEVFAIPGNLGIPQSEGTNYLIKNSNAKLVQNIEDILVELKLKIKPKVNKNISKPSKDLNLFEQKIYEVLSNNPKHVDIIANETKINSSDCLVHLLTLEFRDFVKQLPGKNFIKN